MRFLLLFLVVMCSPGFAAEQELVGNWRLVAFQTILDNEPPKNDRCGSKGLSDPDSRRADDDVDHVKQLQGWS